MSALFRHAIRWGWLGQHENPIKMVRVSSKRKRKSNVLAAEEFRNLFVASLDRNRRWGPSARLQVFVSAKSRGSSGRTSILKRDSPMYYAVDDHFLTINFAALWKDVNGRLQKLVTAERMMVEDPEVLSGTPVIRGTRVPVHQVAALFDAGTQWSAS
jgi:hypothetical protein